MARDGTVPGWISPLLIVGLAVSVYAQTVGFSLVNLDDIHFITLNEHVTTGLSKANVEWGWGSISSGLWHPLTWWSYQLETTVFGAENDGARHTVNLALHVLVSLLVYGVGRALLRGDLSPLLIALLYSVHPQRVQVVAWVAERKELLAACFVLAAFLCHVYGGNGRRRGMGILTAGLFALALLAKPSAMPLVLAIPLYDVLFHRSKFRRRVVSRFALYGTLGVLALGNVLLTLGSQQAFHAQGMNRGTLAEHSPFEWAGFMVLNLGHYLRTAVFPWPLPVFVERPEAVEIGPLLGSLVLIGLLVAAALRFRAHRIVWFGLGWFALFWLPVSGLVAIGPFYVADRYMYLPHIGLLLAVGGMAETIVWSPRRRRAVIGVAWGAVAAFALLAAIQTSFWRDSVTLFTRELAVNPTVDLGAIHLAWAHQERGETEAALQCFDQAIRIRPDGFYGYAYKAFLARSLGWEDMAIDLCRQAINHGRKRDHHNLAAVYGTLGWVHLQRNDVDEAARAIREGLGLFPGDEYLELLALHVVEDEEPGSGDSTAGAVTPESDRPETP